MKCTGKEWDTCRVEKMGCKGCYYDEIKVNEYIKTCTGEIRKVISVEDEEYYVFKMDKKCLLPIYINDNSKLELLSSIGKDQITKHSKEITDLIIDGDFIIYSVTSKITRAGIVKKYMNRDNTYYLGVEGYKLKQLNIKKVITKRELEKVGYEVNEGI